MTNLKKIQTPDQARAEALQIATIQAQYRHILAGLERRMHSAFDRHDFRLVAMLREESESIEQKLLPISASSPQTENTDDLNSIVLVIPSSIESEKILTH